MKKSLIMLTLILVQPLKANWVEGVAQGVDTLVNIVHHASLAGNDSEDSTTVVSVDRYLYEYQVEYFYPSLVYKYTWYVFRDWNGVYIYHRLGTQNGTVLVDDHNSFEIGTFGLPLTKRNWTCSQMTPTLSFNAWARGSLVFLAKHTVTTAATNPANRPSFIAVSVFFGGEQLEAVCGPATGSVGGVTYSITVPRNGTGRINYRSENLLIDMIYGRVSL